MLLTSTLPDFLNELVGEGVYSPTTVFEMLLSLGSALILGFVIYYVYKKSYDGVVFSHSFNTTLIGMTVITSVIIRTISSNLLLSLGLVGALSIVRFRTAIKDPKDVLYLYYAIAIGIACGAGMYLTAALAAIFIGILFVLLSKLKSAPRTYLLIINTDSSHASQILNKMINAKFILKSRSDVHGKTELTLELLLSKKQNINDLMDILSKEELIESVTLVEYKGDYVE